MYLCRLRNALNVKDLAFRFNIKVQTMSTVINGVAKYMYLRLGSLSYWTHRNTIIEIMPESYNVVIIMFNDDTFYVTCVFFLFYHKRYLFTLLLSLLFGHL